MFELCRANFLARLDAVDSPESAIRFQRDLAAEIRAAEDDPDPDASWHRHLLRLLGDALAWKLLSRHTIRELARDRNPPAAIAGQGEDFSFVLEVAERIARRGAFPVVADLTHLIGVGDIIGVTAHSLSIIECKNRTPPPRMALRGRHWRQQQRARSAGTYLTHGYVERPQAAEAYIALDVGEASRLEDEIRACVEQAGSQGIAALKLGERDYMIAAWPRRVDEVTERGVFRDIDPTGWRFPVLAGSGTSVDNPSPFALNPYTLRLPADARSALANCDLILFRALDLGLLEVEKTTVNRTTIKVSKVSGRHHLSVSRDGNPLRLSRHLIDSILFDFRSLSETKTILLRIPEALEEALKEVENTELQEGRVTGSPEVATIAAFVYRDPEGSEEPVLVSQLDQLANVGVSIPIQQLEDISLGLSLAL